MIRLPMFANINLSIFDSDSSSNDRKNINVRRHRQPTAHAFLYNTLEPQGLQYTDAHIVVLLFQRI